VSLKRQLFAASLLMLLIPWAGLSFVLELDSALRQQTLHQLEIQSRRLTEQADEFLLGLPAVADRAAIYARPVQTTGETYVWPSAEDLGYGHGQPWQSPAPTASDSTPALRWQAATNGRSLYLLVDVRDHHPRPFNPARPQQPHDRFELWLEAPASEVERPDGPQRWLVKPDEVRATRADQPQQPDYLVHTHWRIRSNHWQLEVQMPLPPPGSRLGFQVVDTGTGATIHGTGTAPLPALVYRQPQLERALGRQLGSGQQVTITEPGGWIRASANRPRRAYPEFEALSATQIVDTVMLNGLRALVRWYQPRPASVDGNRYRLQAEQIPDNGLVKHPDGSLWLASVHPLSDGRTLILEQSLDQLLSVSGSALGSVLARSLLIILVLTLVLLGYASWLSWRITRLQRLVSASVDRDGRILGPVPAARTTDELGQLQQHFGQMVDRLKSYNSYLESFSRRLSHELKTPVAVVRSSLENLAHSTSTDERQAYVDRAAAATERLRRILTSMSEAARLEQSFEDSEKERFDLAEVLTEASAAYQQLDPQHRIAYRGPETGCPYSGNPDMLVQMLDKLVDNARDFTPTGGLIEIRLIPDATGYRLEVFNEGSRLPDRDGVDIFGAFVSSRSSQSDGHLGQGLLIVRLIADYHGGRVEAFNQQENGISGVCFRMVLPGPASPAGDLP